jgi:Leucine-rich repeat (LRR) protein
MSDDRPKALIVRPTSGLQQHDSGAEKVLSRIVSDALTIARRRDVADTSARIRIGKYEFRGQDYQQILIWAQETGKSPEELVSLLEREKRYEWEKASGFIIDDGSIKEIAFPRTSIFLQRILRISDLPKLVRLRCSESQLTELDLSNVPALNWLDCSNNQLTELDLSTVPELEGLACATNQLTELNLSNVPALNWLDCSNNQLSELALSNLPALTFLSCSESQLTELDISKNPQLRELNCSENQLTELDPSKIPQLSSLRCDNNQINELDIRENHQLKWLKRDSRVKIIKHDGQYFKRPISNY